MIPAIQELNFPSYATLTHAEVKHDDMGEKNITTQVKINGDITPDFSHDWEVEFQGEKYIMPLRQPQGAKENTSLNSTIDLTFQHWAIYQLKRWMFFTVQPVETGTAVADKYIADVILNLGDFCNLFGQVLRHYYGDTITIDLNPDWDYKQEASPIAISHSYIWDVLIKLYELFAVRWSIEPNGDSNHYVIKVGYPAEELDHIFEYGFDGGLLKVERQVQSEDIRNMLLGRGGEKNIPKYYFKKSPDEEKWRSDPDWIEELANIYFTNLMPATFRSYVQGWKAAHISKYPGYAAVGESNAYAPWAYRKGYTDSKFDPVEYVKDDESIAKYGPLLGGLDNNEEIYPSIQGSGMDIAVDVEQILSDDVVESVENDAKLEDKKFIPIVVYRAKPGLGTATRNSSYTYFNVSSGKKANILGSAGVKAHRPKDQSDQSLLITDLKYNIRVFNAITGEERSASGIPAGSWYFTVDFTFNNTSNEDLTVTCSFNGVKIQSATLDNDSWKNTFDIWVKNIWETSKLSTETNEEYAERVWKPILGDREQNTAKVMFTTGALAISEDYEFTIVDFPELDTDKSLDGERSHWRIKLAKSDADLESTGLYVPSTQRQGKAGDKFVFIGTEMTQHYVVWAEKALDNRKKDQLREKKDIKPTWVVTTDRVRLNNEGKANALIQKLRIGNSLRLADKRFITETNEQGEVVPSSPETLYLQSITYTYREPSSDDAALNPDVAIVLSNEYATAANPVATMQGEISALQRQIGSISNVEQIVRAVGDRLYLRKDGISDRSLSPTQFFSLLTSGDFRSGIVGGAGWGFFKDENGNWVLEADRVNVRQEMQVNTLVINQAEGRGGMEIDTAAFMEVTRVIETSDGYVCYFDQKEGSVANLFHIDDVAYCNRWTPENTELKFYKRRVIAVGVDNITLSKTDVNGSGIPAEKDNIIHFGNYTDKTRQYVKVRDVVGGGYERYIEELNSVNATGVEYYFVGKQAGQSRWFVGNKDLVPYSGKGDGSYIEYINRRFNLNNVTLSVNTTIGDKTLNDYITGLIPELKQEDIEGFVNAIVDPKLDGIQDQIDGVIESFFGFGAPTLKNYPANEWTTDEARKAHERDTYTDKTEYVDDKTTPTAGQSWRWQYTSPTDYGWVKIADSDAVKALLDAARAQDTADSKRRTFTAQPEPPYDKGDMWVNATYGTQYSNDMLRCVTPKATGAPFAIGDWTLASKYTDDTLAQEAKAAAEAAQGVADAARKRLDDWAADGVISPTEKQGIKDETARIDGDKAHMAAEYTRYGLGTPTAYNNAHKAYRDQLTALSAPTPENITIPADFSSKQTAYYTARTTALSAIAKAAKDYADTAARKEAEKAVADYEYLKKSMVDGASQTIGGLFLSSYIKLGEWDKSNPDKPLFSTAWSGLNGVYKDARTPSYFAGGDMIDRFDANDNRLNVAGTRYATTMVRMDGSVYFSNGNVGFRADGSGWFGSGNNIIRFANGSMTFGSGVVLNASNVAGLTATLSSISNWQIGLQNLLAPCDASGAELEGGWAEATQSDGAGGIKAKSIKAKVGFWSEGFISARGRSGSGGTSGGGSGYGLIRKWEDITESNKTTGAVSAELSSGLRDRISNLETISGRYLLADGTNANASGMSAMIRRLGRASSDVLDSTLIVTSDIYGESSNPLYYRRPVTALWGYVRGKSDTLYVKKSGDIMTGTLNVSQINEQSGANCLLAYKRALTGAGSTQWTVGAPDCQGVIRSSNSSLIHYRNGVGNSTVWDSGNDGPGSGLDADLLDGIQGANYGYASRIGNFMVGSSRADITTAQFITKLAALGAFSRPQWTAKCSWYYAGNDNITDSGVGNIELAGAVIEVVSLGTDQYTIRVTTSPATAHGGERNAVFIYRNHGSDYSPNWKRLANTSDNVASATKLQTARKINGTSFDGTSDIVTSRWGTARTLWGQVCNGSGNVSGNMAGVGSLSASGPIKTTAANAFRAVYGRYGFFIRNDGERTFFMLTGSGDADGSYNSLRPFILNNSTGDINMGGSVLNIAHGGNVGMGTSPSASHRLDVNGNAMVRGTMYAGNGALTVPASGNITHGATVIPSSDNSLRLGSEARNYAGVHSRQLINNTDSVLWIWQAKNYQARIATAGQSRLTVTAAGGVIIGGAYEMDEDMPGVLRCTEGVYSDGFVSGRHSGTSSDARLKRITGRFGISVRDIVRSPSVSFLWKKDGAPDVGSIAQYWHRIDPRLAPEGPGGSLILQYGKTALLGLKSVACMAESHEDRLADQDRRIKVLERRIAIQRETIRNLKKTIGQLTCAEPETAPEPAPAMTDHKP